MELILEISSSFCQPKKFEINGISADRSEFGTSYDNNPENALPYSCANRIFSGYKSTKEILIKYNITENEYNEIVYLLEEKLSFGCCGLCC